MYYRLMSDYPMSEDNVYYDVNDGIDFDGVRSWALGQRFDKSPPNPIVVPITLTGPWDDPQPPPMVDGYMCLMNPQMIEALRSSGVDNIDIYPAVMRDTDTGKEFPYFGVNILGLFKVADLNRSEWVNLDGEAKLDTIFTDLVIDDSQTYGFHLFRLYESTGTILISERIKAALAHIPFLRFNPVSR